MFRRIFGTAREPPDIQHIPASINDANTPVPAIGTNFRLEPDETCHLEIRASWARRMKSGERIAAEGVAVLR